MDKPEQEYQVKWEIELSATSHKEAAELALNIQKDPNSIATEFVVTDKSGHVKNVDLDPVCGSCLSAEKEYMIGQRVIYGSVICVVCAPLSDDMWIDNPEKGYKHWVSKGNIKPLPNGQL